MNTTTTGCCTFCGHEAEVVDLALGEMVGGLAAYPDGGAPTPAARAAWDADLITSQYRGGICYNQTACAARTRALAADLAAEDEA